jgi:hypothetical protein
MADERTCIAGGRVARAFIAADRLRDRRATVLVGVATTAATSPTPTMEATKPEAEDSLRPMRTL